MEPPLSNSLHDGGVFCTFGNVQLYGSYQDQTFLLDTFWGVGVEEGEVEVDVVGEAGGVVGVRGGGHGDSDGGWMAMCGSDWSQPLSHLTLARVDIRHLDVSDILVFLQIFLLRLTSILCFSSSEKINRIH